MVIAGDALVAKDGRLQGPSATATADIAHGRALGRPAGRARRRRDRLLPRRGRLARRRRPAAPPVRGARAVGPFDPRQTTIVTRTLHAGGLRRIERRLAVARGDVPADLVLRGGRVLSVFTREWLEVDVAIAAGEVAGLGRYDGERVVEQFARPMWPLGTAATGRVGARFVTGIGLGKGTFESTVATTHTTSSWSGWTTGRGRHARLVEVLGAVRRWSCGFGMLL